MLPFFSSVLMGAAAFGVSALLEYLLPEGRLWLAVQVFAAVTAAAAVYGAGLLKLGAVDEVELYGMPAGRRLVRIARKFRFCLNTEGIKISPDYG